MLQTQPYLEQHAVWPKSGRHILAQYDRDSIIVYQAYNPSIGQYALAHGCFGGDFSFERMSWIKTNFLWMMYRSGWGTKPGQEIILAIRLPRVFFDGLLAQAVESSFDPGRYATNDEWKHAAAMSKVRMQWDPDHHPTGPSLPRRTLQLGLRGRVLKDYATLQVQEIFDLSSFVAMQRENRSFERRGELITPLERVYLPPDPAIRQRLKLDENPLSIMPGY